MKLYCGYIQGIKDVGTFTTQACVMSAENEASANMMAKQKALEHFPAYKGYQTWDWEIIEAKLDNFDVQLFPTIPNQKEDDTVWELEEPM